MNKHYRSNGVRLNTPNQLEKWKGILVDITLINGTVVNGVIIEEVDPIDSIESEVTYVKYQNGIPLKNTIQGTHIVNVQQSMGPTNPPTCNWVWTGHGWQWICR